MQKTSYNELLQLLLNGLLPLMFFTTATLADAYNLSEIYTNKKRCKGLVLHRFRSNN